MNYDDDDDDDDDDIENDDDDDGDGAGSRLLRKGGAGYSDGAYEMAGRTRPNPLDLSQHVHSGQGGTPSLFGRNTMLVYFSTYTHTHTLDQYLKRCVVVSCY